VAIVDFKVIYILNLETKNKRLLKYGNFGNLHFSPLGTKLILEQLNEAGELNSTFLADLETDEIGNSGLILATKKMVFLDENTLVFPSNYRAPDPSRSSLTETWEAVQQVFNNFTEDKKDNEPYSENFLRLDLKTFNLTTLVDPGESAEIHPEQVDLGTDGKRLYFSSKGKIYELVFKQ